MLKIKVLKEEKISSLFSYRSCYSFMPVHCLLFEAQLGGRQHIIIMTIQMSVSLGEHTTVYNTVIFKYIFLLPYTSIPIQCDDFKGKTLIMAKL